MKNDRSVPSSTVNVFMSRWYRTSARCEYTYCTPLCGSYGPASPVTHSPGAVLVNCGYVSVFRMLLVVMKDCVVASRPAANVWLIVHGLDAAPAKGTSVQARGKSLSSSVVSG